MTYDIHKREVMYKHNLKIIVDKNVTYHNLINAYYHSNLRIILKFLMVVNLFVELSILWLSFFKNIDFKVNTNT